MCGCNYQNEELIFKNIFSNVIIKIELKYQAQKIKLEIHVNHEDEMNLKNG
jgi:hypothetical protein